MALPSTIYKFNLELANVDRNVYESIQTTAAQHPSETAERLVARLLALAIFFEPGLTFTKGLCAADEPDLWSKTADGRTRLWLEVGLPDAERTIKASRHAEDVALLACGKSLAHWAQQQLPKLCNLNNLTVVTVQDSLIGTLAGQLERAINWSITITEGMLYLTFGGRDYHTAIETKVGSL